MSASANPDPTPATPEELLAAYRAGREDAFTRLVDLAGGRLYGFVARYLGDRTLADDVYQTIWFNVARRAETFDGRARFSTWLYRIARNACVDARRREARHRNVPLDDEGEGSVDDAPDEALLRLELAERIGRAVAALPREQREAFLLKENAGLSFAEIGELAGCGEETAKSRVRYALAKLRRWLADDAPPGTTR